MTDHFTPSSAPAFLIERGLRCMLAAAFVTTAPTLHAGERDPDHAQAASTAHGALMPAGLHVRRAVQTTMSAALPSADDAARTGPVSVDAIRRALWSGVRIAVARSPEVLAATAEQRAAVADLDEAKGARWPRLDVASTSPTAQFGPDVDGDTLVGSTGLNLVATTTVYDWGRTRNTIASRRHALDAVRAGEEVARQATAHEVASQLTELSRQRQLVALHARYVERMQALVEMLAGIVKADPGRSSELTQARARLLQAMNGHDGAIAKTRDVELVLQTLLGTRPVAMPEGPRWALSPAALTPLLDDLARHPALVKITAESDAAERHVAALRVAGRPQLDAVVSGGIAKDAYGLRQPVQAQLALNWNAFRGGAARAAAAAARERASAGVHRVDQQRRDLEHGVRQAHQDALNQLQRAGLYTDIIEQSDGVRRAFFEQWHHLGKRTLLDVLSAESDHHGNGVALITHRFDGYQAVLRQYHHAGVLMQWLRDGERPSR